MRTDALPTFFGDNENRSGRIEYMKNRSGLSTVVNGLENARGSDDIRFCNRLKEIAANNKDAERITSETMEKKTSCRKNNDRFINNPDESDSRDYPSEYTSALSELLAPYLFNNETYENQMEEGVGDSPVSLDETMVQSAEQIVTDALSEIALSLGISQCPDYSFSFHEITSETTTQFAELLFALNNILKGCELSSINGLSVETPKLSVKGSDIDTLTDTIRSCLFKIEMACNVLGIADEVQEKVAQKTGLTDVSGIVQASDPSSLVMASLHTERLFSRMTGESSSSPGMVSLVDKVKELLAGTNSETINITVEKTDDTASTGSETQQFSSSMYRALLKIDTANRVEMGNKVAGEENQKIHLGESTESLITIARNPAENLTGEQSGEVFFSDLNTSIPQMSSELSHTIPEALLRMTEDSVTQQVSERLQSVIRSGLSEVHIQLRPESLGEVKMRIRMEEDVVIVKIQVQNQQVKEIMERNLPSLKDALAQQNITAGTFDIQIGSGVDRHNDWSSDNPWVEQETTPGESAENSDDENSTASKENRKSGTDETGKRYGTNSVEYFA